MAGFDVKNDVTPAQKWDQPSTPTIAAMKAALTTHNATSYSATRLNTMTELDLIYACRQHNLSVVGL